MNKYLILATDGARARFFRLQNPETPELQGGPDLIETHKENNPELEMHGDNIFSTTKSGSYRSPGNGKSHAYDDHRSSHFKESQKRFAHKIAEDIMKEADKPGTKEIILAASPAMLGDLRPYLKDLINKDVKIHEVDKDMTKLEARKLHNNLADEQLLPPRQPPEG